MKTLRIGTVFSGIGAPEQALFRMGIKNQIVFACDNGEIELKESAKDIKKMIAGKSDSQSNKIIKTLYKNTNKENYVKQSYFANYDIKEKDWYDDIRFLNGEKYVDKIDLLVGGSPCQSFSIIPVFREKHDKYLK